MQIKEHKNEKKLVDQVEIDHATKKGNMMIYD
jgi:hypothetical protein